MILLLYALFVTCCIIGILFNIDDVADLFIDDNKNK